MTIVISALQRNASEVVRRVAASGVAEEITDRGRVVAVLCPPRQLTGLEKLRHSGATTRPNHFTPWSELLDSIDPDDRVTGALEALWEQRDDDGR